MKHWKPIPGTPYEASKYGLIRHSQTKRIRKPYVANSGYVSMKASGKSLYFHRAIAQAWIPNPEDKGTVNHKNGNKADNRVSNLEWMTLDENRLHAKMNGFLFSVKVECNGTIYPSQVEAAFQTHTDPMSIYLSIKLKRPTKKGLIFRKI